MLLCYATGSSEGKRRDTVSYNRSYEGIWAQDPDSECCHRNQASITRQVARNRERLLRILTKDMQKDVCKEDGFSFATCTSPQESEEAKWREESKMSPESRSGATDPVIRSSLGFVLQFC